MFMMRINYGQLFITKLLDPTKAAEFIKVSVTIFMKGCGGGNLNKFLFGQHQFDFDIVFFYFC